MATIKTIYLGDLRTENEHLQSGNKVITDAPTDNQGKGEYFSPTDMLATALGSCILTIMGINARDNGIYNRSGSGGYKNYGIKSEASCRGYCRFPIS